MGCEVTQSLDNSGGMKMAEAGNYEERLRDYRDSLENSLAKTEKQLGEIKEGSYYKGIESYVNSLDQYVKALSFMLDEIDRRFPEFREEKVSKETS